VDVANLADRLNNTRNALDGLHAEVGDPHVVSPSESLSTFVSHLDGRVSALEHTVTPPTPQARLLVDNYGGGFVRASAGAVTATPVPVDFALATTPGPNGAVYPNLAAVPAGAAVWADFNGTLGKVKTSSGVDVMSDALKTWITKQAIVTVVRDDSDAAHPVLVVSEVVLPTGSGSSLTLDSLADVAVPADTPDGQVLRKYLGEWVPGSLIDAEARNTADTALGLAQRSLAVDPTSIWLNWRADATYSAGDVAWVPGPGGQVRDYFASDIDQTGGQAPSRTNTATWTLITGADLVNNPALFHHYLDDLRDVTAPADTPQGKVLGTTGTGAWGPVEVTPLDTVGIIQPWSASQSYQAGQVVRDAQGVHVATRAIAPGTATSASLWAPLDGAWLAAYAMGAMDLASRPSPLDSLSNVEAPPGTPVGKVLGTTATGVWGPVDPPAPTGVWKSWTGTQSEFDALPTKDPAVLYIITG
jgi:hypothetical protein